MSSKLGRRRIVAGLVGLALIVAALALTARAAVEVKVTVVCPSEEHPCVTLVNVPCTLGTSGEPDGGTYSWQVGGPGNVTLVGEHTASPSFAADEFGPYSGSVTYTHEEGNASANVEGIAVFKGNLHASGVPDGQDDPETELRTYPW